MNYEIWLRMNRLRLEEAGLPVPRDHEADPTLPGIDLSAFLFPPSTPQTP